MEPQKKNIKVNLDTGAAVIIFNAFFESETEILQYYCTELFLNFLEVFAKYCI